ncbi:MAG: hypothetical protein DRZ82_08040 [Thermoprotei archaeon]|mgnify:CR=1 FL=1|nr:MAG: hypothetical protein DRZ82_08040 [Thermoprotei archaeon]
MPRPVEPILELETLLAIRALVKSAYGDIISVYPKRIARICYLKESPHYLFMIGKILRIIEEMDIGLYRAETQYRQVYLLPLKSCLARIVMDTLTGIYELANDIRRTRSHHMSKGRMYSYDRNYGNKAITL